MKKTYSKPEITFDSFELSQSIAACVIWEWDAELGDYIGTPPGENDRICYHNPGDTFTS